MISFPARRRFVPLLMLLSGIGVVAPSSASATWSIVAVDPRTGEVGSAGASCTGFVAGIVGLAPGHGVIVAQARSNSRARRRGVQMLLTGADPNEVIAAIATEDFDPHYQEQQYGVAAIGLGGVSAVFTGANTYGWRGHATGRGVAVQGNILTGPEVVGAALHAFEENSALPLGERLLLALEAGSAAGGDSRCGDQDALSSYLVVARPGDPPDEPHLKLIVPGQRRGGPNPVHVLRVQFEQWRNSAEMRGLAAEQLGVRTPPSPPNVALCGSCSMWMGFSRSEEYSRRST